MAGETVMRVDADLDLNAERLPMQLRKAGDEIGRAGDKAGKDYANRFDGSLSPQMREAAARLGKTLNEKLTIDNGVLRRNENAIRLMGRDGQDVFDRLGNSAFASAVKFEDSFRRGARNARFEVSSAIENMSASLARGLEPVNRMSLSWADLSHNTKQWTLIISTVAAAMVDLAGLSSALGAGIFSVGGALSAAVLGAGAFVAVGSVLFSDLSKLPPELQATAAEAKAFGKELNNLRFTMADRAFQEMPGAFTRLRTTVGLLTPQLGDLGAAAGKVFDSFTRGTQSGTAGFTELQKLIENAAKDLPTLAKATGTWGTSLIRGVNKANPMVEQLLGYVDLLGTRFDAFTRSSSFDTWVRQSMGTFTEFGRLLDATGRMLNDLVTPDTIARTQQFLRDLTGFMPALGGILSVLGDLNVFGLAAQLLNDFGQAIAPVLPPLSELAGEISGVASIVIGSLADALHVVTPLLALLAQGAADFLGALPPGSISAITFAVIGLSGALGAIKVAEAVGALGLFGGAAETAAARVSTLAGGLRGLVGKAGLIGLVTAAVVGGIQAFGDWTNEVGGWNETARQLVGANTSLQDSFAKLRPLDNLKGADFNAALQGLVELQGGFLGLDWPITQAQFSASTLGGVLGKLDETMGKLPVPQIQSQFQAWAKETNATDAQLGAMLGRMPGVSDALRNMATQLGYTGTQQDILNLAMGQGPIASEAAAQGLGTVSGAAANAADQINRTYTAMQQLAEQELISRDAHRGFEAATQALSDSIANNTSTLTANGAEIDISTAAGRANQAAVDALAQATSKWSDQVLAQTGNQVEANAVISDGRGRLIEMLGQLGITGQAAEDYANKLGLIPKDVSTLIQANGLGDAISRTGDLKYMLESINGSVYSYQLRGEYIQYGNREITPPTATGGTFAGPQKRLIGEAGPEAVVPLRRPLSQVDPSVRWLSAIAQGIMPRMASGGIGGTPSKTVVFEAGAIVVQGTTDPREAALEVADAVAERVAS